MVDLTSEKRKGMPSSDFALSGRRFPLNDPTHDRLAIGGATRAEHAGNISASTADRIKAEARAKLGDGKSDPPSYKPADMAKPRTHALSMAAATHLQKAGHITPAHAANIHAKARANINQLKGMAQAPATPSFGSLSPMLGTPQS